MNITLVQTELHWENKKANLRMLDSIMEMIGPTDIIILTEMFSTAFSNRSEELAEPMDGETVSWLQSKAKQNGAAITGSAIIQENGNFYNRMLWVTPEGDLAHYDKRHLFRMTGEHKHFAAGQNRVIVNYKGWRILLQVCYDLRFPVFARNRYADGQYDYDLILYVANWPKPRHNAWTGLLRARAIENLSYCIGVNRTGSDANGLEYNGGSAIIDFLGNPIKEGGREECILQADLNMQSLRAFREKFPTGMDADEFVLMA